MILPARISMENYSDEFFLFLILAFATLSIQVTCECPWRAVTTGFLFILDAKCLVTRIKFECRSEEKKPGNVFGGVLV